MVVLGLFASVTLSLQIPEQLTNLSPSSLLQERSNSASQRQLKQKISQLDQQLNNLNSYLNKPEKKIVEQPSLLNLARLRTFSTKQNADGTHPLAYVEFFGDLKPQLSMTLHPQPNHSSNQESFSNQK